MKIGVVGFSQRFFDHDLAKSLLNQAIVQLTKGMNPRDIEIVSGLTNAGVPKLAYQIAHKRGYTTIGISAKRALRVNSGIFPCDKQIIVGENFGDESEQFIEYIDYLIRVGGGSQSRKEVELFKEKKRLSGANLSTCLIEKEIEWLGKY